jgi:hypothetical protein
MNITPLKERFPIMSTSHKFVRQAGGEAPVDLSVFDAKYVEVRVPSNNEVPDGKYQVRVEDVELTRNANGRPMLTWDLLVVAGQFTGWHIFKRVLITSASLPIIKSDLIALGLALDKFSTLPLYLDSLVGKTLAVAKRTKKDFSNIYFHRQFRTASSSKAADDARPF